jgi:hypothetical protein
MGFDYSNIEGALTPEQAAAALAAGEGDTSAELENGGAPDATTVTDAAANDGDNKAKPTRQPPARKLEPQPRWKTPPRPW